MTKRKTASKLTTRGSWPPVRYSIQNVLSTRSTTSQKELNLCIVSQGEIPCHSMEVTSDARASNFFCSFSLILIYKRPYNCDLDILRGISMIDEHFLTKSLELIEPNGIGIGFAKIILKSLNWVCNKLYK